MTTTGLAVVALGIIVRFMLPGYDLYFTKVVLQTFAANVVIHTGFIITRKFESKYLALEVFLDITYTTTVLIAFGMIFDWFEVTPIWVLVIMAVIINLIVFFLNMARIRENANIINKLLKSRDKNGRSK